MKVFILHPLADVDVGETSGARHLLAQAGFASARCARHQNIGLASIWHAILFLAQGLLLGTVYAGDGHVKEVQALATLATSLKHGSVLISFTSQ